MFLPATCKKLTVEHDNHQPTNRNTVKLTLAYHIINNHLPTNQNTQLTYMVVL